MKKLLLTSALLGATVAASFGQGTISLGNNFGKTVWQAPIYGPGTNGDSSVAISGNSSLAAPTAGTTVYDGALLQGTGWDIAFYAGPTTATSYTGMQLLTIETAFSTATGNVKPAGLTTATATLPVTGVAGGALANYQVFVWSYTGANTQDQGAGQALIDWGNGLIALGQTPIETTTSGLGGGVVTAPNTTFNSFNTTMLTSSPEPATLAIAGLGAAGLLLFRRKK